MYSFYLNFTIQYKKQVCNVYIKNLRNGYKLTTLLISAIFTIWQVLQKRMLKIAITITLNDFSTLQTQLNICAFQCQHLICIIFRQCFKFSAANLASKFLKIIKKKHFLLVLFETNLVTNICKKASKRPHIECK